MISLEAARDAIAEDVAGVEAPLPGGPRPVTVYRHAVSGRFTVPAVIIGSPEVEFDTGMCADTVRIPVAVAVGRDGTNDAVTQTILEDLLGVVAERLRESTRGGRLFEVASTAALTRADYEQVVVQGATYPAYVLTLDLHG